MTASLIAADVPSLLARAVSAGASDLHLLPGEPARLRIAGELRPIADVEPPSAARLEGMVSGILPEHLRGAPVEHEVDFSHQDALGRRYRVSAFRERRGVALAFRVLSDRPPSLQALNLPRDLLRTTYASSGLVLFAGHAGAGKTTTLASVLQSFCERRQARLITLEDPVEYRLDPGLAYLEQREVGRHCTSFEAGVRDAIEAGPDAIAIGELRDLQTIRLALEAAETGMLVFATVHAYDAARTIGRLMDAFDVDERPAMRVALAATLRMVAAQTLLARKDGDGRVPAIEVVFGSTSVATLIREGKEHELGTVVETTRGRGTRSLDDSLVDLVRSGTVTREEALRAAVRPESLARLTSGAPGRATG